MSEKSPGRKKAKPSVAREAGAKYVAAADFKATCLELMDNVKKTGDEYVITKHGKPVAKLVPCGAPKKSRLWGSMKGSLLKYERPFDPIDGEYDIDRE
jgi:prevent-host-death family protein